MNSEPLYIEDSRGHIGLCENCGPIKSSDFDRYHGNEPLYFGPNYSENCPFCNKKLKPGRPCPSCKSRIHISDELLKKCLSKIRCKFCDHKILPSNMAYDIKLRYRLGKKEVVKKLSKDSDSIKTKKLDPPRISLYIADSEDNIEIPNEERWKKLMKREGAVLKWNE